MAGQMGASMQNKNAPLQAVSQPPLARLAEALQAEWPHITHAAKAATDMRKSCGQQWANFCGEDRSIVVFGSLARDEFTESSDVDWTLLVDGKADPGHLDTALQISEIVAKGPGPEGVFGNLVFSHDIVHCIGGEDDSNANTTRRILLLLESKAIGVDDAWKNVRRHILYRYLKEDIGLRQRDNPRGVPLFLLNDISRYWRTMTVDFAYKQRTRLYEAYALKSIKLGFSRKLIYLSGVLACLRCELEFEQKALFQDSEPQRAVEHLETLFAMTPLELFADSLLQEKCFHAGPGSEIWQSAKQAFDAYDSFLELLADGGRREALKSLLPENLEADEDYQSAREQRHKFSEAVKNIFLRLESPVQKLMLDRGVM